MTVSCRPATHADRDAVPRLLHELKVHYWGADKAPTLEDVATLVADRLLVDNPSCEVLLAETGGKLVGLATFAVVYPGPRIGGVLFLKDLYIRADARGGGIGEAIMRYLARLAVERGCERFDWTTETSNPRAMAFYDRLGAKRVADKVYYRFDGEALTAMASATPDAQTP